MEYNSQRSDLIIPEYGRNVQQMVDFALTVEDREERNQVVGGIIKVMGQLFPYLRDIEDYNHKLWDHLHVMSNFKLEVDSPYPKPEPTKFESKPNKVNYPDGDLKFSHYGSILPKVIEYAKTQEDSDEKQRLVLDIANLMKRHYLSYGRNNVTDEQIKAQLKKLSDDKLGLADDVELVSTNSIISSMPSNNPRHNNKKKSNNNNKKKKRR